MHGTARGPTQPAPGLACIVPYMVIAHVDLLRKSHHLLYVAAIVQSVVLGDLQMTKSPASNGRNMHSVRIVAFLGDYGIRIVQDEDSILELRSTFSFFSLFLISAFLSSAISTISLRRSYPVQA